jgi:hypothetical protein
MLVTRTRKDYLGWETHCDGGGDGESLWLEVSVLDAFYNSPTAEWKFTLTLDDESEIVVKCGIQQPVISVSRGDMRCVEMTVYGDIISEHTKDTDKESKANHIW